MESLDRPIIKALNLKGISDELLAKKLKEELDASLPKLFQSDGNVIESREIPVWDVRQRARQDAHKLRGDYPSEKHTHTFEGGVPVVPLTPEEQQRFEEWKRFEKEKTMKNALKTEP